jgi:hypothetical protein
VEIDRFREPKEGVRIEPAGKVIAARPEVRLDGKRSSLLIRTDSVIESGIELDVGAIRGHGQRSAQG